MSDFDAKPSFCFLVKAKPSFMTFKKNYFIFVEFISSFFQQVKKYLNKNPRNSINSFRKIKMYSFYILGEAGKYKVEK